MTWRVLAIALGAAALFAQVEELPVGSAGLTEDLGRAHLAAGQETRIREALKERDYHSAEALLVDAINADPKAPDLLAFTARVFMLDKNPGNAAIALKKAEKIRPLSDAERFMLAMAYLGIRRGEWARPELEKLAAADRRNPLYPYWLSRIEYDEHKYDAAIARLREVTGASPTFMRAWDNLGLSLEAVGRLEEAQSCYRKAIGLNREQAPHSPWPPLNLATLLTRMGDLKEAEQLIRESIRYQGDLAEAHYRLGLNLHKQGRAPEAIEELRQATKLDPAATGPLYELGQIYREEGNDGAAAEAFARFRQLKKQQRGTL